MRRRVHDLPAIEFAPVRLPLEPGPWQRLRGSGPLLLPRLLVIEVVLATLAAGILGAGVLAISLVGREAGNRFVGATKPIRLPQLAQRSTIYAANGTVLDRLYLDENRVQVALRQVPSATWKAVLAIEDSGFYRHGPLDLRAIVRALLANARAGGIVQGGSTISQQLIKNTITGQADTFVRKLEEARDAFELERTYSKRQILSRYLNTIIFGHGVYGIGTAARWYFGVPVRKLTLPQSATLAGMIAAPSRWDPVAHPVRAIRRRNVVLRRMQVLGWIGTRSMQRAIDSPMRVSGRLREEASPSPTSYWTQYIVSQMLQDPAYGETYRQRVRTVYQSGLQIRTTLDPSIQRAAEASIEARMTGAGLPQSAVVTIDPKTGAIRAMAVGNQSFQTDPYNLATDPGGGRSAGSSFKVFTLAAALIDGISPSKVYNGDSPKTIPNCGGGETWRLENAEPGSGSYTLAEATANSVNVVFAQVIDEVGPEKVAEVARRMGIHNPLTPVCPLTLGTSPVSPLEMTSGVATLANRGIHCEPFGVAEVLDSTGAVLSEAEPTCERAIPTEIAATETRLLEGVISGGTGTAANIGRPAAGKTGTGQNYKDAWFIGYTPQLATGVWVGYAAGEIPMPNVPGYGPGFGGTLAAPIWRDVMFRATQNLSPRSFPSR